MYAQTVKRNAQTAVDTRSAHPLRYPPLPHQNVTQRSEREPRSTRGLTAIMAAPIISPAKIREAVAHYMDCGSLAESSRRMGLNESTLVRWRYRPEWGEVVASMERELDAKFKALLRKQFATASKSAIERIEQGDMRMTRDGQLIPVPVTARDSALVAGQAMDRLRLLEGKPQRTIASLNLSERASRFAAAGRVVSEQHTVAENQQAERAQTAGQLTNSR